MPKRIFIYCDKCGKKLLERMENGLFRFQFGNREGGVPVVDMEIQGNIRMKCIRRSCRHENILNFLPGWGDK